MTSALAKAVMRAIKANNIARIKALAQASRMSRGKLMSQAKRYVSKKKRTPKTMGEQSRAIARKAGKR
jgi:hypothetical protein|tara:strand:- start:309 stop:512 length:204 start_codon:yes stop_codon:yes gene_type:complete